MTTVALPLGVLGASIAVLAWRMRGENALQASLEREAAQAIEAQGFTFDGAPFGSYTAAATVDGEPVVLDQTYAPRPGVGEQPSVRVARVKLRTSSPSTLLVCRRADEESMVGPVPARPRVETGDARFDAAYACHAVDAAPATAEGYRDVPRSPAMRWAVPELLGALRALSLSWMQVRDGELTVAFDPLAPPDLRRATELALQVARALRGEAPHAVSDAPRAPWSSRRVARDARTRALVALIAGLSLGPLAGVPLAMTGIFNPLYEAEVCGPHGRIRITSTHEDGGVSFGAVCDGAANPDADLYVVYCILTVVALVFALAAARSLTAPRVVADVPRDD